MPNDAADVPKIIEVAGGLCVRQEIDNITWIDMGDYGIVVDALEQPGVQDEVFAAIRRTLGDRPLRYVLNTHTHYDHVVLNDAFRREFGAEIVNQRTAPTGPAGRWFKGSRRGLHWIPMPGCHTDEDCVAWIPEDRVVLTGDIFGWGLIPLTVNLRADSSELLLKTYQRLIDLDPAVMIPGHGPLGDKATLQRWAEYFHWLRRRCAELVAAGLSDEQIAAEMPPPQDMKGWWRFVAWKHADSVSKMIKPVRKGWL
jgi:cyclase